MESADRTFFNSPNSHTLHKCRNSLTVMNDSDMVFLVHSDIVVLTDRRETFCAAGLEVREFSSHDCTLAVLRSGSLPRGSVAHFG
jgi:hypothetical protein